MRELMYLLDDEWLQVDQQKRLSIAPEATFYILAFTLALRGEEVPLIALRGIISHWERGISHSKPHVMVMLLGQFKNKIGESYHLMPVLDTTPRCLQLGLWVEWVMREYQARGVTSGYMFRNEDGTKIKQKTMEDKFYDRLEYILRIKNQT
jgi:hypothetical protein